MMMADLVHRRVAVIGTPAATSAALAAKAATATVPIVFAIGDDPVKLGLVTSFAQRDRLQLVARGGDDKTTGAPSRIGAQGVHVAVLVNPANATNVETTVHEVTEAAPPLGLEVHVIKAKTANEIDAAFAAFAGERPDAVFIASDAFFLSRRVQIANLAARDRVPASYSAREHVEVGGLMTYGTPLARVSSGRGLYRQHSQRCHARRPAGGAIHQVRADCQSANGQVAWPRYSSHTAAIADEVIE